MHILLNFQPDQFVFSVRDEGIGISDDEVKNLFKFSTTTSTQGTSGEKGSGLGLLMCADFIEKHHGKLGVTSEEGKGSTFSFSIPIKQISTLNGSH